MSPIFEKEHNLQSHCLENPVCYQQQEKRQTFFSNDELKEHQHDEIEGAYKISVLFHF